MSNKYFGTDGFRGEVNIDLTAEHAYKIGRFLGWYFGSELCKSNNKAGTKIVIGKDCLGWRCIYIARYHYAERIIRCKNRGI